MTRVPPRSWLRPPPPAADPADPALTVVAVPHAGAGAASFARWPALLGPGVRTVRVQLPGREDVTDEAPLRRMDDVIAVLAPQVARLAADGHPLALYGHSMGALVVFELARALTAVGLPPVHLAVSGRRAPQRPSRRPAIHRQPDDAFLAALDAMAADPRRPAGPPPPTPAQQRYSLRVARADIEVSDEYRYRAGPPLAVPVSAFVASHDPIVDPDEVLAWGATTSAGFAAHLLDGGHFFHQEHRGHVAALLRSAWADLVPALGSEEATTRVERSA